ncbi:MAG: class II aldolase/adducin family protein [Acidimicrobiales bacterium]|nr:class II aldolase/adducin family protein [Acidimicrobiales bacterium]
MTTFTEDHPAFRVAAARRILAREGCESRVAGHVSVRAPDRADAMWVSPFGYFDETLPSHVIKTTLDLDLLEGDWEASPAVQFHADLYAARPDVQSVVHTHSHWVEVYSCAATDVGYYSADSCLFHDEQVHYADDGISPPVHGPAMAAALGADRTVCIAANHGAVIVETTLERATVKAIALETSCRAHVEAQLISGKEMPVAEIVRLKSAYEQYFIPMMWDATYRRLRRSDPDLFAELDG